MKDKILDILKSSRDYVSGEDISSSLGISRAAVWKHIKGLKEEGYEIESSSKKGYRLLESPDVLTYKELKNLLTTNYIGRKIVYLESTTSTNDIAKEYAEKGEKEGLVVIAEVQTKGRGRMGRRWITPGRDSISITILLRPEISPYMAPSITPVLAVSVVEMLREITGFEIGIKWPNDVVLDRKKVCGILTEMSAEIDVVKYIIVGIGINVNQETFDNEIENIATSLRKYSGKKYDRKAILSGILNRFERNYELFKKEGIGPFIEDLKKYSVLIGKKVLISGINEEYEAEAIDIDDDGALLVRLENGDVKKVLSGDVSIKGFYGYNSK
ncbi:biotin--[acetyl-CoA-carboxylase] ligase [Fonticella tunisiensis]|uniref:Bifunctional ligase/repressor BirA n=1 Tax=Fonticella tunisiensis TaxID=1096341 RepID=A0A4R7K8J6_9CLOT|nr:biotin--[acetyl-CoA-carboxylase] ligase [Fonticella tunisiensis]TDT50317.1 BirA family biotin operon repressor/biotin-[acetyl-CoA-carboxylase] ligase [Fonticella tunisiensis]